ncbi:MAG: molybdenum cofactor guanylyltransferase [Longimicrobiales bacterium]
MRRMPDADTLVGAILAGGRSRRYGSPKAFASVGGVRLIERVIRAVAEAAEPIVVIANEPEAYAALGFPVRSDALIGTGVLGGIHAALSYAREIGAVGALVVACDMPFIEPRLLLRLRRLREDAGGPAGSPDIVAPESSGRRGVEPLCAIYGRGCIGPIEAAAARGDRRAIAFWPEVRVQRLPLAEVSLYGAPERLFMNVNTPAERAVADATLGESGR